MNPKSSCENGVELLYIIVYNPFLATADKSAVKAKPDAKKQPEKGKKPNEKASKPAAKGSSGKKALVIN